MTRTSSVVLFAPEDYASTTRRVFAALVDFVLLILVLTAIGSVLQLKYVPPDVIRMPRSAEKQRLINKHMKPAQMPAVGGWVLFCIAYHTAARRFPFGTAGYLVAGLRIVDPSGSSPPWRVLIRRFALAVPFVGFFGISYLKCRQNPRRQAFHDQWCGTWVVRRAARPQGPAKLAYQTKLLGPFLTTYVEVEPLDESEQAAVEANTPP